MSREYRYDDDRSTDTTRVVRADRGVQNGETALVADTSGDEVIYHRPSCKRVDTLKPRVVDDRFRPCKHCIEDGQPWDHDRSGDTGVGASVWLDEDGE